MIAVALTLLFVLLGLGLHVASALGWLAFTLSELYAFLPVMGALGELAWGSSSEGLLVAVPMFILMGELLLRSDIAEDMFRELSRYLAWLPGGVMHTNVGAAALFAATSGSSVATAATIGTVAMPNMLREGYNPRLFLASIAASGTLGILIPPSINMIVYGLLAEVSVSKLYLAAVVPGVVLALLFSLAILLACIVRPAWGGNRKARRDGSGGARTLVGALLAPIGLFVAIIGSIYTGLAAPSEAASIGAIAALVLCAMRRRLNVKMLRDAFEGTMKTTAMVMLIIIAAVFLSFTLGTIGLTERITQAVSSLSLTRFELLFAVCAFYLVLGCFMDPLSMIVTTAPIVIPVMTQAGWDPVWFGVVFMILSEAALITPPIGMNLFVIQSLRPAGPFSDLAIGILPFLGMMILMIALLALVPDVAMWLPRQAGP